MFGSLINLWVTLCLMLLHAGSRESRGSLCRLLRKLVSHTDLMTVEG